MRREPSLPRELTGPPPAAGTHVVRGACPHDCPDGCAMLVTVADGRAVEVRGDPEHPFTRGHLCAKVARYLERVYSPDRILHPMRRTGEKGSGEFTRVSWDEALDEIAERLGAIARNPGPQAILPYSYAGTMGLVQWGSMDRRFFHRLGASLLDRTICTAAGYAGSRYSIGTVAACDPEDLVHSRYVVLWGVNVLSTHLHFWPLIAGARQRGARVVCIDPIRTRTAAASDWHVALAPGTDAALALGMAHVILAEGLEDRDYLERHAVGLEAFRHRVRHFSPRRVAELTGLDAEDVARLAREYATRRPAGMVWGLGFQRTAGGGMAARAITLLPALVGAWREVGGGIFRGRSGAIGANPAIQRADLIPPDTRTINMVELGKALTDPALDPPVLALYVYNSNPAVVAPNQALVERGLRRADLFTVVHEQFWNDTAACADLVLPATTQLEHFDLIPSWGHYYLTANRPAVTPLGEARPNSEVFRLLARRMGFDDPCFQDSDEDIARQALAYGHPHLRGLELETLLERGWQRVNVPRGYTPYAEGGFPTPSGKCEFYSEAMAVAGLDPLPAFVPPRESPRTAPDLARRFPLQLISAKGHYFLNTSFSAQPSLARDEGPPVVELHPEDAGPRGIATGDRVRVYNDRGDFLATARVTADRVRPGVCFTAFGHWHRRSPGGRAVNYTTSDALTDFGGGPVFYDNLVQVKRLPRAGEPRT